MIHQAINKVALGQDLTEPEMTAVMDRISEGEATPAQIGALLMGLRMKGECASEIAAGARVLRSKSTPVPVKDTRGLVDTCGTGGDGKGTFNVSTTAAFVVAGCGLKVAKHGNRAMSSRCGSADVLEALGVRLDLTPEAVGECIDQAGIGFLFAPALHPAMRHAVLPRREIGLKSIFNLLGPLTNPAGAEVQVIGVFRSDMTETLAQALARLGCQGAFVVHGHGGLDEISITGPSRITRLERGHVTTTVLVPEEAGLKRAKLEDILGGDSDQNAAITLSVLKGDRGPCRDMVLLNAAAALVAAGQAGDFKDGVRQGAEAVDSGRAARHLDLLIELSQNLAPRQAASA